MTINELRSSPLMLEAADIAERALEQQQNIEAQLAILTDGAAQSLQADHSPVGQFRSSEVIDTRIISKEPVISPQLLSAALPLSAAAANTTLNARIAIENILRGRDDRLLVIAGPCSTHDGEAALEYACAIAAYRKKYGQDLEIIKRNYDEKPRSDIGWKGMVLDPYLDGSYHINTGLALQRLIALRITELGVPIAKERLNASTPQYSNGLVAYDAIGARNVTDQKAREYASGTSSPVGFKNAPDGNIEDAVMAMVAAHAPHSFIGLSMTGSAAQIRTSGNALGHVILRGGKNAPNYGAEYVDEAVGLIRKHAAKRDIKLLEAVVIDASHGNSGKIADRQGEVVADIARQLHAGSVAVKGVMLESFIVHGRQGVDPANDPDRDLVYGMSITDECISLEETEPLLEALAAAVRARRRAANP